MIRRSRSLRFILVVAAGLSMFGLSVLSGCDFYYDVDAVDAPPTEVADAGSDAGSDTGDAGSDAGPDTEDTGTDVDACEPDGDEALCNAADFDCGDAEIEDNCGDQRTVDCGGCADNEDCLDNQCVCEPLDDEELCDAHSPDACGENLLDDGCQERLVDCGDCDGELGCNTDLGICEACTVDCTGKCGMVPDGCGAFVDCGADPNGTSCQSGESCQNFECVSGSCDPQTSCDTEQCGEHPDGCGGVLDCEGNCPDGWDCDVDVCVCQEETDDELCDEFEDLGLDCGTFDVTDRCDEVRSIDCGGCPAGQSCEDNQCVL